MFKKKEEMTIAEIHARLGTMGFGTPLENLAKMKPTELKKFYKKARKAFDLYYSIVRTLTSLSTEEEGDDE